MKQSVMILLLLVFAGFVAHAQVHTDTVLLVTNTKVELHFTNNPVKGVILVLPGWNFAQDDICLKSDFCELAKKAGYILILPDMKKTVYQQHRYPETRVDWLKYHTLEWLTDTLIPLLQYNYGLLKSGEANFLFGISTGARGVAMMALYTKGIFVAGAALSGDYNQELMSADNLMKGYYGSFASFPLRWSGEDNPYNNAAKIGVSLFLAHGLQDKIVPCEQTKLFFTRLQAVSKTGPHQLVMKEGAGHDYAFWSSMYPSVFKFFSENHIHN